jgi:hypothetical protein
MEREPWLRLSSAISRYQSFEIRSRLSSIDYRNRRFYSQPGLIDVVGEMGIFHQVAVIISAKPCKRFDTGVLLQVLLMISSTLNASPALCVCTMVMSGCFHRQVHPLARNRKIVSLFFFLTPQRSGCKIHAIRASLKRATRRKCITLCGDPAHW